MVYRKSTCHGNADGMSRCVTPWKCQCNEVDTKESLKCLPCKKCEKRAVDMKSSLLMGCLDKDKEVLYQPKNGGEAQNGVDQMMCVTESVGPNNNGRNGELGKLTFESGTPCVDGHFNVESVFELNTMIQIQFRENCDDSKGLVSLRSGSSTVEKGVDLRNEDCNIVSSETETCVQAKEKVRAIETRSKNTQGEGQTQRNSWSSTVQPDKVILSNYTDTDLSMKQKEDSYIKFVYESMLKGCKRPDSSITVTKSPAARHYLIIWDSLKMSNGLLYKESLQKNGESKYL